MKRFICGLLMLAASSALLAAQLYRWVDERGTVEWRDTPPPPTAKKVEQRNVGSSAVPASELPYSLQQAVKNFPVTLWIMNCGEACDKARAHLSRRGVPHVVKDPYSDIEGFKKASGGATDIPLLLVGSSRLTGYLESAWDTALDIAGYPRTALVAIKPELEVGPVRLYTNSQCGPSCDEAKKLLTDRRVAFQEVAVDTPVATEELRKLSGKTVVPTLATGRFVVQGFNSGAYARALDESGHRRGQ